MQIFNVYLPTKKQNRKKPFQSETISSSNTFTAVTTSLRTERFKKSIRRYHTATEKTEKTPQLKHSKFKLTNATFGTKKVYTTHFCYSLYFQIKVENCKMRILVHLLFISTHTQAIYSHQIKNSCKLYRVARTYCTFLVPKKKTRNSCVTLNTIRQCDIFAHMMFTFQPFFH